MAKRKVNASIRYGSSKMAVDVKIENIKDYLCEIGPSFCSHCLSKCAYGERYLQEVLNKQENIGK